MRKILLLFFLYTILGLTNSQSSNNEGNSTKLLIRRNKNLMKGLDKMIIKRNLDEEDTISEEIDSESSFDSYESSFDSDGSNLDESSYESSPNQTEPIIDQANAEIYLIDIMNFSKPNGNKNATFNIIIYYVKSQIMKYVFFTLKIIYLSLRNLDETEERLAICELEDFSDVNKTVSKIEKYKCETNEPINRDNNLLIKAEKKDFKSGHSEDVNKASSMKNLNFSHKIEKDLENIQTKTQNISNYYILNESIYDDLNNNRFTIKGIMEHNINDKEVNITLFHNEVEERNVVCKVIKNQINDYQMRCNAQNRINASLVSAYGITDQNNVIIIYMKEGFEIINTGSEISNRLYSKKSGSGLSGGGIAGIVIACVVALVIASIVAIMLKKPKTRIQNTSSIIQANSVDNLNG